MQPQLFNSDRKIKNPMLFVGGCPRSGTTLLQRMLDHHPDLAVANDTHFIVRALKKTSRKYLRRAREGHAIELTPELREAVWQYHRFFRLGIDRQDFDTAANGTRTYQQFVTALFDCFASRHNKRCAGEKTPDYVRYIPELLGLFPQAKFIEIVRDGRDVTLSLMNWADKESDRLKGPARYAWWRKDPLAIAAIWWNEFATCKEATDDRVQTVRYEDLVTDAQAEMARIGQFLNLEGSENLPNYHQGRRGKEHASAKQQWLPPTKGLRDWRTQMSAEDQAVFDLLAGTGLKTHNYPLSGADVTEAARQRAELALAWWRDNRSDRVGNTQQNQLSAEDRLIRNQPSIKGLARVLDNHRFSNWVSAAARGDVVGTNNITLNANYIRLKPQTNCLVGYQHDAMDHPWGFAIAHSDPEKIAKATSHNEEQRADAPTWIDAGLGIVAYQFPRDPELPQLSQFWQDSDDMLAAVLDRLQIAANPSECKLEILSYKPLRRCVAKVQFRDIPVAVLRFYSSNHYALAAKNIKYAIEAGHCDATSLANSDRHKIVAHRWIPGDKPPLTTEAQWRVASQLAAIHATPHKKLPIQTHHSMAERLERSRRELCELLPHSSRQINSICERIRQRWQGIRPRLTLAHGDFHLDQVVQTGDQLTIIDWDNARNAPPELDVGSYFGHLCLKSVMGPGLRIELLQLLGAFLDGYRSAPAEDDRQFSPFQEIGAHTAFGIVNIASQPFRQCVPAWEQATSQLLELAEGRLGTKVTRQPKVSYGDFDTHNELEADDWLSPALRSNTAAHVLASSASNLSPCDTVRLQSIHVVRHLENRRALIHYRFRTKAGDTSTERNIYGKARKKGLDLFAWDAQQRLHAAFPTGELQFAEPLGLVPQWNLWLQSVVEGRCAEQLISPTSGSEVTARIGRALGALHAAKITNARSHTRGAEYEILESGVRKVAARKPKLSSRIETVLAKCHQLLASHENPVTGIHRDFYPAQVLVQSDRIAFVDNDLFAQGDPAIDVGNFIAHLQERAMREFGCYEALAEHERAFVDGYFESNTGVSPASIEALTVVSLARHIYISHRIVARRPYRKKILSLVEQQLAALRELESTIATARD